MLPAVAVVTAIQRCVGEDVRPSIKWVNDILIDGYKVAGVLTATLSKQRSVETAVFGVGLNVAHAPGLAPTPFVPRVGSLLQACGEATPTLGELLWLLLEELANGVTELISDGPAALTTRYLQASQVVGQRVAIYREDCDGNNDGPGAPLAEGIVRGINPDLSLVIEGQAEPVYRGRLAVLDGTVKPA
jgi:BirA family biotin operon repressor/biotin-[acetyl-CoA-carboxylase] ligase